MFNLFIADIKNLVYHDFRKQIVMIFRFTYKFAIIGFDRGLNTYNFV